MPLRAAQGFFDLAGVGEGNYGPFLAPISPVGGSTGGCAAQPDQIGAVRGI